MYDLIVIGGGPGGYEAAAHAGSMGTTVSEALREAVFGVH
jgi:pyruvate/2-oxoglutarate dehydrogenase complex dihydrolipoamide dehydrogenase (E3) component